MITRRALLAASPGLLCAGCAGHGPANPQTSLGDSGTPPDPTTDTGTPPGTACLVTPEPGWLALPLADHPELAIDGGFTTVDDGARALIVARVAADCIVALDRRCTHEGVEVTFSGGRFVCPRHGSAFATDGTVLGGPAPLPLAAYPVGADDDTVYVG